MYDMVHCCGVWLIPASTARTRPDVVGVGEPIIWSAWLIADRRRINVLPFTPWSMDAVSYSEQYSSLTLLQKQFLSVQFHSKHYAFGSIPTRTRRINADGPAGYTYTNYIMMVRDSGSYPLANKRAWLTSSRISSARRRTRST